MKKESEKAVLCFILFGVGRWSLVVVGRFWVVGCFFSLLFIWLGVSFVRASKSIFFFWLVVMEEEERRKG